MYSSSDSAFSFAINLDIFLIVVPQKGSNKRIIIKCNVLHISRMLPIFQKYGLLQYKMTKHLLCIQTTLLSKQTKYEL